MRNFLLGFLLSSLFFALFFGFCPLAKEMLLEECPKQKINCELLLRFESNDGKITTPGTNIFENMGGVREDSDKVD